MRRLRQGTLRRRAWIRKTSTKAASRRPARRSDASVGAAAGSPRRPRRGARRARRGGVAAPRSPAPAAGRAARQRRRTSPWPGRWPAGTSCCAPRPGASPSSSPLSTSTSSPRRWPSTGGSLVAAKVLQVLLGTAAVGLLHAAARPWFGRPGRARRGRPPRAHGPRRLPRGDPPPGGARPVPDGARPLRRVAGPGDGPVARLGPRGSGAGALRPQPAERASLGPRLSRPPCRSPAGSLAGAGRPRRSSLGLALAVAPATLRNLAASGEFVVPVASHGGLNFYIGNHAGADGTDQSRAGHHAVHHRPGLAMRPARPKPRRGGVHSPRRRCQTSLYRRALGWDWPPLRRSGRCAGLFWRASSRSVVHRAGRAPQLQLRLDYSRDEVSALRWLVVGAWLLVPLGLLGFGERLWSGPPARERSGRRPVGLRSVGARRARLPRSPWRSSSSPPATGCRSSCPSRAGAGFALVRLVEAVRARATRQARRVRGRARPRSSPSPCGPTASTTAGRRSARSCSSGSWTTARERRRCDGCRRSRRPTRSPRASCCGVGQALDESREAGAAAQLLERSLALDPSRAETRLALGRALFDAGRTADAIPHLRAALDAGFRPETAAFALVQALAATGQAGGGGGAARAALRFRREPTPRACSWSATRRCELRRPDLALRFLDQGDRAGPADGGAAREARAGPGDARSGPDRGPGGARGSPPARPGERERLPQPRGAGSTGGPARRGARALAREALRRQPDYPQARGLPRGTGAGTR